MSKGILTKKNSQIGEVIERWPNMTDTRHSIHFETEDLKDYWISRYLFGEANYDFKTELEEQPEFAFIQNSAIEGIFTIKVDYYVSNWGENINSLLNKDTAIIKWDNGKYALYNLSEATNEGEKNISYHATLNIFFTYQPLNLLVNNISMERTHSKNNFINLDKKHSTNIIKTNFNKREMFEYASLESKTNINFPSIFLFYATSSDSNPSQNSLYNIKIIPICSGNYYPSDKDISGTYYNSTINAINTIYDKKDSNLKYIMILSETPWMTKKIEIKDGVEVWNGAIDYDSNFIDYEQLNNAYIFHIKNTTNDIVAPIFEGIYKLKPNNNSGDYAPHNIVFNQVIKIKDTYSFDYGVVRFNEDSNHIKFTVQGSSFPLIGESKIIFLGGVNSSSTIIANQLNIENYETKVLYGEYYKFSENLNIYPIKITNLDDINFKFETPTGNDLYNLDSNGNWYYFYVGDTNSWYIPNNSDLWGKSFNVDDQVVLKELDLVSDVSQSTFNFLYRFDLKNYMKKDDDIHLFQSEVKSLMIGIPNTGFNLKIPINVLNNEYLYIVGVLDLYKLTTNYFLLLDNYNVNSYESNFIIEDVQLNGPTISSDYLQWYNGHKTSRMLGRLESGILLTGGLIAGSAATLMKNKKGSLIGFGISALGGSKGLNMLENKKNLEQSPAKTSNGDDMFFNFVQPYNNINGITKEDKLTNFDFSLYMWEETPEDQFQENERNNIITSGIQVSNLVPSVFSFGQKQRYQFFQINDTYENIESSLSAEIKYKINETFNKGITLWYFRSDLVFNGIKNYDQENLFIDEITKNK